MPKLHEWGPRPAKVRPAVARRVSPELAPGSPDSPFAGLPELLETYYRIVPHTDTLTCTCRLCGFAIVAVRRSRDLEGSVTDLARLLRHVIDGHVMPTSHGLTLAGQLERVGAMSSHRHLMEGVAL